MAVALNDRFKQHAITCENLLGSSDHLNRLNDDELESFRAAKAENTILMKLDSQSKLYTNELNFYNAVLSDVLENQEKSPRPPGP